MSISSREARELAATIADLQDQVTALQRNSQLSWTSIDEGALDVIDADGNIRQTIGEQPDGTYTTVDLNGPIPPAPSTPIVEPFKGGLVVTWDGTFVGPDADEDGEPDAPADFAHVEVHVGTEPGYVPSDYTQVATINSLKGGQVTLALPLDTFYVRLQSVSTSKQESAPSEEVAGYPDEFLGPSTDGAAPGSSPAPTVIGGIGALHVRWAGVENQTPVTYEVHLSTVSDFVPEEATKVAETPATSVTIRADHNGTALSAGPETDPIVYFVKVVAYDVDAKADPSAQGSGSLFRVGQEEISASYAYFGDVTFDQLTGGTISATAVLAGGFITDAMRSGQRLEMLGTGLTAFGPSGEIVFDLPAALSDSTARRGPTFRGDAAFDSATFNDNIAIRGNNNEISAGSSVTLASGVTTPSQPPASAPAYASTTYTRGINTSTAGEVVGWSRSDLSENREAVLTYNGSNTILWLRSGSLTYSAPLGDGFRAYGMVPHPSGNGWLVVGRQVKPTSADSANAAGYFEARWYQMDPGESAARRIWKSQTQTIPGFLGDGPGLGVGFSYDTSGAITTWEVADLTSASQMRVRSYAFPTSSTSTTTLDPAIQYLSGTFAASGNTLGQFVTGVLDGRGPSGAAIHAIPVNGTIRAWPRAGGTSSASPAAEHLPYAFPAAAGTTPMGLTSVRLTRNGSNAVVAVYDSFRHLATTADRYVTYTDANYVDATAGTVWYAAYAWYNVNSGLTTRLSPKRGIVPVSRAALTLSSTAIPYGNPNAPDYSAANNPNAVRFYIGRGTSTSSPTDSAMYLQPESTYTDTTVTITTLATSGSTAPTSGTFPQSSGGTFKSNATRADGRPKTQVGGDGFARLDGLLPPGVIVEFAGSTIPDGWLLCDGRTVSRTIYPDLFNALGQGAIHGYGDSTSTFNLPNHVDRSAIGAGGVASLGGRGGASAVTLTTAHLPSHSHGMTHGHGNTGQDGAHNHDLSQGSATGSANATVARGNTTVANTGTGPIAQAGGHTHTISDYSGNTAAAGSTTPTAVDVRNPYVAMNFIIKW